MFGRTLVRWGLLLFFISITIHQANAVTWYVTPDGTGDWQTIQAAIVWADSADTILVGPGVYSIDEDIYIWSQPRLYLISESGAEQTIIDAGGRSVSTIIDCAPFWGEEVVVRGFTFQFFAVDAISIGNLNRVVIEENIIRYNGDDGITVGTCGECYVRNNVIYSNGYGIAGSGADIFEIKNNTVAYQLMAGILVAYGNTNVVSNNVVTNNYLGVACYSTIDDFSCNNVYGNSGNYAYMSDQTGINGNISVDPQYCAALPRENGNFFLQSDSPCVPGNHPDGESCGLIGALSIGCSTTSTVPKSWSSIKSMYNK